MGARVQWAHAHLAVCSYKSSNSQKKIINNDNLNYWLMNQVQVDECEPCINRFKFRSKAIIHGGHIKKGNNNKNQTTPNNQTLNCFIFLFLWNKFNANYMFSQIDR